jgi:hypothetical protein
MTCGVFVRVKDFQKLMGFNSYSHSHRTLKYICESLKKERITVTELCNYLKIAPEEYDRQTM